MSLKRKKSAGTDSLIVPVARPPRTIMLFFLLFFLLAETALISIDLFYLFAQNGTVSGFLSQDFKR